MKPALAFVLGLFAAPAVAQEADFRPCMAKADQDGWRIEALMQWQEEDVVVVADMSRAGAEPPERLSLTIERGPNWRTGALQVDFKVPPTVLAPVSHEVLLAVDRDRVLSDSLSADAVRDLDAGLDVTYWRLEGSTQLGQFIEALTDAITIQVSLFQSEPGFRPIDRADFDAVGFLAAYQRMKQLEEQLVDDRANGACRLP